MLLKDTIELSDADRKALVSLRASDEWEVLEKVSEQVLLSHIANNILAPAQISDDDLNQETREARGLYYAIQRINNLIEQVKK